MPTRVLTPGLIARPVKTDILAETSNHAEDGTRTKLQMGLDRVFVCGVPGMLMALLDAEDA